MGDGVGGAFQPLLDPPPPTPHPRGLSRGPGSSREAGLGTCPLHGEAVHRRGPPSGRRHQLWCALHCLASERLSSVGSCMATAMFSKGAFSHGAGTPPIITLPPPCKLPG